MSIFVAFVAFCGNSRTISGDAGLTLIMLIVFRFWTGRLRLRPTPDFAMFRRGKSARYEGRPARGINVPSLYSIWEKTPRFSAAARLRADFQWFYCGTQPSARRL